MGVAEAHDKLKVLIPRLASDSDGEVLATVAAIRRTLTRNNADLHDLAAAINAKPQARAQSQSNGSGAYGFNAKKARNPFDYNDAPREDRGDPAVWQNRVSWLLGQRHRLGKREAEFVENMVENLERWEMPTERQGKWLNDIFDKLGGPQGAGFQF